MAKKSKIARNKQRMEIVERYAPLRKEIKAILHSGSATEEQKDVARAKLRKLPRNSSPIRLRNRCMLTGRPRAFYRKFGLCRLELRKRALSGELPGVTKASW
jgi:small subunit ribosomal protein S14